MRLIDADALKQKFYDVRMKTGLLGLNDVYDAIEEAPTATERKWIPCSERLPEIKSFLEEGDEEEPEWVWEHSDDVLVCADGDITLAFLDSTGIWVQKLRISGIRINVQAWMPLPEPYKEEELND